MISSALKANEKLGKFEQKVFLKFSCPKCIILELTQAKRNEDFNLKRI
jgi:phage FluMu protein Com